MAAGQIYHSMKRELSVAAVADRKRILFLCTGNSCRSQMAEALAKQLHGDTFEFHSAGIVAHGMNPNVERVMEEVGISLLGHYSKTVDELGVDSFDCIVTVCDHAAESCPILKDRPRVIYQPFADPPKLAKEKMSEEDKLDCYRKVREDISLWLSNFKDFFENEVLPNN